MFRYLFTDCHKCMLIIIELTLLCRSSFKNVFIVFTLKAALNSSVVYLSCVCVCAICLSVCVSEGSRHGGVIDPLASNYSCTT